MPVPVGSPAAPTIGPLSFHPYPYLAGYPTKVLIAAVRDQRVPVVLTGSRCGRRQRLRFRYGQGAPPGQPPFSGRRWRGEGRLRAVLPPARAGLSHTGYMLFTGTGKWEITVAERGHVLGVLLVTVTRS